MKASANAHDWHCEDHDTYGWRGEACRMCPEAPDEQREARESVKKQLAAVTAERDALLADNARLEAELATSRELKQKWQTRAYEAEKMLK